MTSFDETTRQRPRSASHEPAAPCLMLTIAWHPSLGRVGERALLSTTGERIALSRRTPEFLAVDGRSGGPLADPHISRSLLTLSTDTEGTAILEREPGSSALSVDGVPLEQRRLVLPADALKRGVILELAGKTVLVLQSVIPADESLPKYGLVGESVRIHRVRQKIREAAALDVPLLIRGESGTGKELVARAVHDASSRAAKRFIAINMAALNPETAIAELFGHTRGSFTGATQARDGHFRDADGGTIFLDEVGETPNDVQAMLLRVLESGEIQPLGGATVRGVNVRVIAATDADLPGRILQDRFRLSLLHRLAGYEVSMPPLRERREDIARLFVHFIEREAQRAARPDLLLRFTPDATALLPCAVMVRLLMDEWAGNVRQLNNVARRLTAALLVGQSPTQLLRLLDEDDEDEGLSPPVRGAATAEPVAAELSDDALLEALRTNSWNIARTARQLDISRNTVYARMQRNGLLRKARDLSREELADAHQQHKGDLKAMAEDLGVSLRGLQLRLRELSMIR